MARQNLMNILCCCSFTVESSPPPKVKLDPDLVGFSRFVGCQATKSKLNFSLLKKWSRKNWWKLLVNFSASERCWNDFLSFLELDFLYGDHPPEMDTGTMAPTKDRFDPIYSPNNWTITWTQNPVVRKARFHLIFSSFSSIAVMIA